LYIQLVSNSLCRSLRSAALAAFAASLLAICAVGQNPVPQIVGPVHPDAAGGGDFTLGVYGANFVPGAVVNWNYRAARDQVCFRPRVALG
jgi:hypothetical protein